MGHEVIEHIIQHHAQAIHVLSILKKHVDKYGFVSFDDYYSSIGAISTLKDNSYGWVGDSLLEAFIVSKGSGYVIMFPPAVDLLAGKEAPVIEEQLAVRLDTLTLLHDGDRKHALVIAERLLNICGLTKVWDSPEHGHRIFYVRSLPQDIPQAGIYWIKETLVRRPDSPFEGGETKL